MLLKLPLEIQVQLLKIDPTSSLKFVNSHFYVLYNDLFYDKIVSTFGDDIINVLIKVLPWMKAYIRTLDVFRFDSRNLIASRLNLTEVPHDSNPLHCIYVKDSWKYIYSILKNNRLFAEYTDYKIDEPTNYIYNHFVEINRTYLLSYSKNLWLSPGKYNLNIGLVLKHGSGLGTTKFEIRYKDEEGMQSAQTFYPPTNINDILPQQQFCLLKVGEFYIPRPSRKAGNDSDSHKSLVKVEVVMEEIGLYLKSGFRIFFIDIAQPSLLFNDYDLLYYSIKETDYKYFINLPLKNFYKALHCIQNADLSCETSENKTESGYGKGDPYQISDTYETEFLIGSNSDVLQDNHQTQNYTKEELESQLTRYGNFFFHNEMKRFFKFNTIYQQRQFINRFGDFQVDWDEQGKGKNTEKNCNYDRLGLKWRIPILGEL